MKQPIPHATPKPSRKTRARSPAAARRVTVGKVMENFRKGPDVSEATKVGEPTLVDPKQASAPDLVRAANSSIISSMTGSNKVGVERVGNAATPGANAPVPRSDAAPAGSTTTTGSAAGTTPAPAPAETATSGVGSDSPSSAASDSAVSEMKNDLQPAVSTPPPGSTAPPPMQTNDAAAASSSSDSGTQPAASNSTQQPAPPVNSNTESSSKKKKKHHWPF